MSTNKKLDLDYYETVDECDRPRAIFYQFKENREILKLIENFPDLLSNLHFKERSFERFLCKKL